MDKLYDSHLDSTCNYHIYISLNKWKTWEEKEMKLNQIDKMQDRAVREYLKKLIEQLDELDLEDFFGTEGWRRYIMKEDR